MILIIITTYHILNYITFCISIFAGYHMFKNRSLTLLMMGKILSETCWADLIDQYIIVASSCCFCVISNHVILSCFKQGGLKLLTTWPHNIQVTRWIFLCYPFSLWIQIWRAGNLRRLLRLLRFSKPNNNRRWETDMMLFTTAVRFR